MGRQKKLTGRHGPPPALARATALWRDRRYQEALRSFNEAVREAPNDPAVLIDAARALGARYQSDRCLLLLKKAQRLGSRRAEVLQAVGQSYRMLGYAAQAEACFRSACRLAATPQSELELARLCERRHALDEAAELVDRVLRAAPQSAEALLLRARIERRRGEIDRARATLRQLTADSAQHPRVRAEAFGELCVLLDSAGEYEAAWEAILSCKQLLLQSEQASWNAAQLVLTRASRMVDALTASHFQRWQTAAEVGSPRRIALLTGFPRSGTTLLEQVLDAHPEIVSAEETEVFSAEVFPKLGLRHPPDAPIDRLLDELTPSQVSDARQLYVADMEAILGEPIGARLLLDKNPAMNLLIPAMKRIFPELKLVIALRDPRDVVVSCFLRYLPVNPVSVCFLTLERTVDRYILDMGAWLKMRDLTGDWLEVRYEHVVSDLPREARRTLDGLNVAWDATALDYRQRTQERPVRSPSYEEVSRPVFTTSIGRWQNYERQLQPMLAKLAPLVEALGYPR